MINMQENVKKFFEIYNSDPDLQERLRLAEESYPGSLEVRESVVEYVLLPVAEEMGLPFTVLDLKVYETKLKAERHKDVALTEEELSQAPEEPHYWLLDHGWEFVKPEDKAGAR
jgi:hypothetical protein